MENEEIKKLIERQLATQERIIKVLEKISVRIKNLEEFVWKELGEKKKGKK